MDDYAGRLLKFVAGCGVGSVLAMGLEYMAMKLWAWRKDEDEKRVKVKAGIGAVVRSVMAGESAAREKAWAEGDTAGYTGHALAHALSKDMLAGHKSRD